jgi:hypothetical protein
MYKEIEKYKTGNKNQGKGVFPDGQEINILFDEYVAGLGDLMTDYIKHINKPFWKRNYYHDHLTKIYLKWLNGVNVKHNI